jgi:hypothetical protein
LQTLVARFLNFFLSDEQLEQQDDDVIASILVLLALLTSPFYAACLPFTIQSAQGCQLSEFSFAYNVVFSVVLQIRLLSFYLSSAVFGRVSPYSLCHV